jgi:hypothetical protein
MEAAQSVDLQIKTGFPILQVAIYDRVNSSFADKSLDNDLRRIEHSFTTQISTRDRMGHRVLHPQTLKTAELRA